MADIYGMSANEVLLKMDEKFEYFHARVDETFRDRRSGYIELFEPDPKEGSRNEGLALLGELATIAKTFKKTGDESLFDGWVTTHNALATLTGSDSVRRIRFNRRG
ncbi:MAG: hypothetical protein H7338_11435 [Candidatus Sericytochromatia bacterium]|nr:hypothetical protein [Candidatus Sericytochromatia bacterium]